VIYHGLAELRGVKFCIQIDYIISQLKDDKSPIKERGQRHVTYFLISTPTIISPELTVSKFCMQAEYIKCLAFADRLLPNGRVQGHMTRFF